jgi:DNA mismatch repair protein MutL
MWTVAEAGPAASFESFSPQEPSGGSKTLPPLRILGQVHATYIVAEGPDGLYVIDQHAAHERIVYDRLSHRGEGSSDVQGLLEPLTIHLSPAESATLNQFLDGLRELGFDLEPFGGVSYLLRSMPASVPGADAEGALHRILHDLSGETRAGRDRLMESVACHAAVRAGQQLTFEEMRELVRQLERTEQPRTCPHGRPTVIVLDIAHLERLFARRT